MFASLSEKMRPHILEYFWNFEQPWNKYFQLTEVFYKHRDLFDHLRRTLRPLKGNKEKGLVSHLFPDTGGGKVSMQAVISSTFP